MGLHLYTLEENEQWDSIVRSFSKHDVYWLSGYVKAFKIHGDGEPLLFYYEDKKIRGINVVMKRDIAFDKNFVGKLPEKKYYDFSSPYGYGGWIIEGSDSENLFAAYENWCRKNNVISEFVRFHPAVENHIFSQNSYNVIGLGNTILMDISTPEIIWSNIISKNRNMIRKAKKNGVQIYSGRYPEIFSIFREIYNKTMDKDHADEYYYFSPEFYDSILTDLPHNAHIFYAVYKNKVIAASIMLTTNGRMNYHLSGSIKEYSNLAPTNLLLYEAALWGSANGCKTLYLGGGVGSQEDSLYKFKKSFYRNDDVKRFYIGKKIFNQEKYDELVQRRGTIESNFFPLYRA
jgi:hypothetical protein